MKIRLIATDLDGTLMAKNHVSISERNIRALQQASSRGIKIVVASGRPQVDVTNVLDDLKVTDYAVLCNGAVTVDIRNNRILSSEGVSYNIWSELYDTLLEQEATFELYHQGKSYIQTKVREKYNDVNLPNEFIEQLTSNLICCDNVKEALKGQEVEKINVLFTPEHGRRYIEDKLKQYSDITVASALPGNLEITSQGVNKGKSLKDLCKGLNIFPEEVMVFGDSNNDLEMLNWAKWSFAMENATKEANAAAGYHTKSNIDDGVAQAIEQYILNQKADIKRI